MQPTIRTPEARIAYLEAALRQIATGEGPYSRDPLTHAANAIEAMQAIAQEALAGTWTLPEEEVEA